MLVFWDSDKTLIKSTQRKGVYFAYKFIFKGSQGGKERQESGVSN